MIKAYKDFWKRACDFDGISTRSLYWWIYLCNLLIELILYGGGLALLMLGILDDGISAGFKLSSVMIAGIVLLVMGVVYDIAIIVPGLALMTRRFHDAGVSGNWVIVYVVAMSARIGLKFLLPITSIVLNIITVLSAFVIVLMPSNAFSKHKHEVNRSEQ